MKTDTPAMGFPVQNGKVKSRNRLLTPSKQTTSRLQIWVPAEKRKQEAQALW